MVSHIHPQKKTFSELVLIPRSFDYQIQFCGPTGTNAVEAALKLAKKIKKRTGILMGAYHGMTLGSLSVSGNMDALRGNIPSSNVTFMPYPMVSWKHLTQLSLLNQC